MKTRSLTVLTVLTVLAGMDLWGRFDARLHASQDPLPRDRFFFTFTYFQDATTDPSRMQPRVPFAPITSTILVGANNTVCLMDGATRRTSAPLQVYGSGAAPVNFAPAEFDSQRLLFTAPGNASSDPMAAFVFGPPHRLLGDFGMIEGGDRFGVSLAAGNVSGDSTPELFVATANGGPPMVHMISPGRDEVTSFFVFNTGYTGGVRMATGDIDGDGFDELGVAMTNGPEVQFIRFDGGAQVLIFNGFPFGETQTHGPFIDLFDVNNDGRAEAIFGTGSGGPLVRIVGFERDTANLFTQFRPFGGTGGVAVAGGLVNGAFAIGTTPQNDPPDAREFFALYLYHLQNGFGGSPETQAFGPRSTAISLNMFEPSNPRP